MKADVPRPYESHKSALATPCSCLTQCGGVGCWCPSFVFYYFTSVFFGQWWFCTSLPSHPGHLAMFGRHFQLSQLAGKGAPGI